MEDEGEKSCVCPFIKLDSIFFFFLSFDLLKKKLKNFSSLNYHFIYNIEGKNHILGGGGGYWVMHRLITNVERPR